MASKVFLSRVLLSRTYATVAGPSAVAGDSGGIKHWRRLTLLVAIPGVLLCYLNSKLKEADQHFEYERPEYKPYSYMCNRTKRFPWGDGNHSLFHNKHTNALPTGYEG